jgi:hypothetical protein
MKNYNQSGLSSLPWLKWPIAALALADMFDKHHTFNNDCLINKWSLYSALSSW